MKNIFLKQGWHAGWLFLLLSGLQALLTLNHAGLENRFWGLNLRFWFWLAVLIPILHQVYVWLVWRLELQEETFTSKWGLVKAFRLYSVGFSVLFLSRLIFIIILALGDQGSLGVEPILSYSLAAIIAPGIIYLFYSVKRYFTIERAFGIDHFNKNFNEPYEKRGIFRYTSNGMYIFGLMILYLPGLLLLSKLALMVAIFNHLYIWVHYYCTELPDMEVIYGKKP